MKAKLSKVQRLVCYKATLRAIQKSTEAGSNFVCPALKYITSIRFAIPYDSLSLSDFPEFLKQKPEANGLYNAWWTASKEGNLQRIAALKAAIKLCQPVKK